MRQTLRIAVRAAGLALLLIGVSQGQSQSLGDVARQQRQKQQAKKDLPAPKVISNEDLPERTQDEDGSTPDQRNESEPHSTPSKSPEHWKAQIEAQKQSIATLQHQMERLNASIHFVEASRYYTAGQHNERQEQKMEQVQRMQDQLDLQKKRLDEMQEGARKDGFGNAVYDP